MKAVEDLKRNFYKDGTKELHLGKITSSIVVVIALIVFVLYKNADLQKKTQDRSEHLRYTIGITGNKRHNFRSSKPTVVFYYKILQKEYEGLEHINANYEKNVVSDGGRYYVEFSSKNPSNSKLLLG